MAIRDMERSKTDRSTSKQAEQRAEWADASAARRLAPGRPPRPFERHDMSPNGSLTQEEGWAYGLGLFGIGLGLMELLAPRRSARMIGAPPGYRTLTRMMGLREIANGIGILSQRSPATAVWLRVAGDAIDLGCLGAAFMSGRGQAGSAPHRNGCGRGCRCCGPAHRATTQPRRPDRERRHSDHRETGDQPPSRRAVPVLARLLESAALHETPEQGRRHR